MNITVKIHIKEARNSKGISIRQLAEKTNLSKSYLSEVENGHYMPSIFVLCKIAIALDVKPEKLFSYEIENNCP